MSQEKLNYVAIDIIGEYFHIQSAKSITLNHGQMSEIFRQILELIDKDFINFTTNLKTLKYDMVFYEQSVDQHCIDELNTLVTEVSLSLFFKLQQHKLLNNHNSETGFPFFAEHITSNTLYLRQEPVSPAFNSTI